MRSPLLLLQKSFTPKIIGVVNLTKHSFSQDGVITKSAREVKINRVLSYAGGVDLGGECSGPGAPIINAEREKRSIRAALRIVNSTAKKQHPNAIISVDTRRPEIAHLALSEGANMINDVSGGRGVAPPRNKRCSKKKERNRESELPTDYSKMTSKTANTDSSGIMNESMLNMFEVIREFPFSSLVIMYSPRMHGLCSDPLCEEPTTDNTLRFFDRQLELAARNGVSSQSQIILDPGLGRFLSQDSDVSVRVIVETIPKIQERFPGHRLFLGASRKGFLDNLAGRPTFPQDRVGSSLAMLAICQDLNVDFVRLHDVEWAHDFLKVREKFRCEETVQNVE